MLQDWDPNSGRLDIGALHQSLAEGALDLRRLFSALAARIDRHADAAIWITRVSEEDLRLRLLALENAWKSGGGLERYPLFGIPFAVKDNIDVEDLPTTAGCPAFAYHPSVSAPVVRRLEAAGAVCLGKTNMDQFATGLVGTRSPYGVPACVFGKDWIPGGSSSGSAVAVAAGLVSFALGTDTAGSGRVPAAFNNIVGLKPTRGLLSTSGVVPACRSLDCVSIFALHADDARSVLRVAQGWDADDPFSRAAPAGPTALAPDLTSELPGSFTFGIPPPAAWPDGEYGELFGHAKGALEKLGGTAREIDFEPLAEAARMLYQGPWIEERRVAFGEFVTAHPKDVLPVLRQVLAQGGLFRAGEVYRAYYRLRTLRRKTESIFASVACLLLPTAPKQFTLAEVEADPLGCNTQLGRYTNFANLLDLCALALPAGFTSRGLAFGVTLMAPAFHDEKLAILGAHLHAAQGLPMGKSFHPVPAPLARPTQTTGSHVVVAGLHLSGQPLNSQLLELGATLVRACRTAPVYRLYALRSGEKLFPGLLRRHSGGAAIAVEVWELSDAALGIFLRQVKEPLCLGTVELEDGEKAVGFLCEAHAAELGQDITVFGGWKEYRKGEGDKDFRSFE